MRLDSGILIRAENDLHIQQLKHSADVTPSTINVAAATLIVDGLCRIIFHLDY